MNLSTVLLYDAPKLARVLEVNTNGKTLVTPTYFPAISSFGIKYSSRDLIRLLINYSYPRILVSAYDLFHIDDAIKEMFTGMAGYLQKGGFIFLDSGVYEKSWKADPNWTFDSYRNLVSQIECDFYCSFDILPNEKKETYQNDDFINATVKSIIASRELSNKRTFVPILHGSNPIQLVSLIQKLLENYPDLCNVIAIAERDCGESILERAKTIVTIRKLLDESDRKRILHILGCGNPTSLALYSYCGANMFDSLDWIKCVINRNNLITCDFSQLELLSCNCSRCSKSEKNYVERALLHNLLFYQDFMSQIRSLIRENALSKFLLEHTNQDILKKIESY